MSTNRMLLRSCCFYRCVCACQYSAKAHVSRSMLERLREDVRWFAGDQNAKTAPELVGFSDAEVCYLTVLLCIIIIYIQYHVTAVLYVCTLKSVYRITA
jgi:hypothetical protein